VRIGIHTSTAGSLERAALTAHQFGASCFQIFSASPRMWRANAPDPAQVKLLAAAREKHDLTPLAIHTSYLINLASADPVIRGKSIDAFAGELDRAEAIGAEYLVTHPGTAKDASKDEAIDAFAAGVAEAVQRAQPRRIKLLIENTAGAGGQIGSTLEELSTQRERILDTVDLAVGYCLDTCHLLAAGFEIRTAEGLSQVVKDVGSTLGWDHVHLIHANDSKGKLGSHLDRHAHIGEGEIGREAFARILRHPKLKTKPFILETPVDEEGDELRNVRALQELARPTQTTAAVATASKRTSGKSGSARR
jgi:deoxyribonuclease-4